jgi:hypothetical protein
MVATAPTEGIIPAGQLSPYWQLLVSMITVADDGRSPAGGHCQGR